MCGGAVFGYPSPHPRLPDRRSVSIEDAADNNAIDKHVEVVIARGAGRPACRRALGSEVFSPGLRWLPL